MTKKTKVIIGISIFVAFAIYDFWHGYHHNRLIPLGVVSVIGGILSGIFYGGWPLPTDDRADKHKSSGTLV